MRKTEVRMRGIKILIGIVAAIVLFAGLKFLYRYFITDRIMDGEPDMDNPARPMLDYLSVDWEEPCGWRVRIDGYQMEIFFSEEKHWSGGRKLYKLCSGVRPSAYRAGILWRQHHRSGGR